MTQNVTGDEQTANMLKMPHNMHYYRTPGNRGLNRSGEILGRENLTSINNNQNNQIPIQLHNTFCYSQFTYDLYTTYLC